MRLSIDARLTYRLDTASDLLFAIEAADTGDQRVVDARLVMAGTGALTRVAAEDGVGQRAWTRGEGVVSAHYAATVEIDRPPALIATLPADPLPMLPAAATAYLWPSRYCESDRFEHHVRRRFGDLSGGAKVQAIADWVTRELAYVPGASDTTTTAADSFVRREGVCRDYAHLMIAMVRAADIPARMVGCYAMDVTPPDFHAAVEVWLDGAWRLMDPSARAAPTGTAGVVRIGVGRDATDVSFLTVFGTASYVDQRVTVTRIG